MVGYAAGYEPRVLYRLAAAFEDATAANENARLVLFATCDVKDGVRLMEAHPKLRLVRAEDVRIPPSTPREIAGNAALVRYVVVRAWLRERLAKDPRRVRKMMITDTRDVALFGDPFEQIDASNAHVAQLFTEAARRRSRRRERARTFRCITTGGSKGVTGANSWTRSRANPSRAPASSPAGRARWIGISARSSTR
jgi:hypothetical protein